MAGVRAQFAGMIGAAGWTDGAAEGGWVLPIVLPSGGSEAQAQAQEQEQEHARGVASARHRLLIRRKRSGWTVRVHTTAGSGPEPSEPIPARGPFRSFPRPTTDHELALDERPGSGPGATASRLLVAGRRLAAGHAAAHAASATLRLAVLLADAAPPRGWQPQGPTWERGVVSRFTRTIASVPPAPAACPFSPASAGVGAAETESAPVTGPAPVASGAIPGGGRVHVGTAWRDEAELLLVAHGAPDPSAPPDPEWPAAARPGVHLVALVRLQWPLARATFSPDPGEGAAAFWERVAAWVAGPGAAALAAAAARRQAIDAGLAALDARLVAEGFAAQRQWTSWARTVRDTSLAQPAAPAPSEGAGSAGMAEAVGHRTLAADRGQSQRIQVRVEPWVVTLSVAVDTAGPYVQFGREVPLPVTLGALARGDASYALLVSEQRKRYDEPSAPPAASDAPALPAPADGGAVAARIADSADRLLPLVAGVPADRHASLRRLIGTAAAALLDTDAAGFPLSAAAHAQTLAAAGALVAAGVPASPAAPSDAAAGG